MLVDTLHATKSHSHLVALACAAAALAAALYNPLQGWFEQRKRAGAERTESNLLLDVKMDGQLLHIGWNRRDPILQKAERGVLSIHDGSQRQSIPLSAAQLHQPNEIVYSPFKDEVDLKLEISGPNIQKQSQSVLFVLGRVQSGPAPERASITDQRPPTGVKRADEGESARPLQTHSRRTPLVFVKPVSTYPANYTRPSPLKQIRPDLPAQLEPALQSPLEIDVRVTIDRRGIVVLAKLISQAGSFQGSPAQRALLIQALLETAMQSKFRPARIRSKPVSSQLVLAFRWHTSMTTLLLFDVCNWLGSRTV
jgi:hypothetical protein